VVFQDFDANVDPSSYAILGNDVLIKCDLPSFVTDLVTVTSWHDSEGNEYHFGSYGNVSGHAYVLDLRSSLFSQ